MLFPVDKRITLSTFIIIQYIKYTINIFSLLFIYIFKIFEIRKQMV